MKKYIIKDSESLFDEWTYVEARFHEYIKDSFRDLRYILQNEDLIITDNDLAYWKHKYLDIFVKIDNYIIELKNLGEQTIRHIRDHEVKNGDSEI